MNKISIAGGREPGMVFLSVGSPAECDAGGYLQEFWSSLLANTQQQMLAPDIED